VNSSPDVGKVSKSSAAARVNSSPAGGREQGIQERCGHSHVLAGPGKSWRWCTFVVDGGGDGSGPSSGFGEVDGDGSLCPQHGLASV
jgi:hypothetical protein